MKLESEKKVVNATKEEIFTFIKNSENLIELLPQDSISDWQADENKCSFKVQGGVIITLIQNGDNGKDEVYMKSGEKSPFEFNLIIHLNAQDKTTEGFIEFDGKVNMFLKLMVEKPLKNLFNHMTEKLQEKFA